MKESEEHADAAAHGVADKRKLCDAQSVGQPDNVVGQALECEVAVFEVKHDDEATRQHDE